MSKADDDGIGGWIRIAVGVLVLWALIYGVTINGRRYGITDCDSKNGVTITIGEDAGSP